MKNSGNIKDINIPYPSEGVVRTASINDTVAPQDSVQVAVNMNFDQIGSIKTRLGLTTYADDLEGEIKNFGKLDGNIELPGFSSISKVGSSFQFSDEAIEISTSKIDDTHIIAFWGGADGDGFTQVFEIDPDATTITSAGSLLEFDTNTAGFNHSIKIDDTHFLNIWAGTGGAVFGQIFSVNTISFNVTKLSTAFQIDTEGADFSLSIIDANHVILFYQGPSVQGKAVVLEIDLSTWAVSEPGSDIVFDTDVVLANSSQPIGNGTHFVNFWTDLTNGATAQSFSVDLSTWNITQIGSPLTYKGPSSNYNSAESLGDGEHFINFWSGPDSDGFVQVFNVDPTTFAVTEAGAELEFETGNNSFNSSVPMGDGKTFANFWRGSDNTGFAGLFEVDLSTFNVIGLSESVSYGGSNGYNSAILLSEKLIINSFQLPSEAGSSALFRTLGPFGPAKFLYAQQGDGDVFNWDGTTWENRRSGLSTESKARFTQFLNYIWMVNGNASIGDEVKTSNGGEFGNDLVPAGFPPGDFIQAGFEGRVWVADKLFDVVYFTDIVQFTPPDIYELTYNPEENFIKNFSPQNGQTITGLVTTARALLLFKQDSIYRIYGAYNVDAYPAYHVGTYSQESIVQTKDGLFFHHSSGFYRFNYNSEPIEISRRVIDFVNAIPRSNYEEVQGIFDGFDAISWAIGPVTVEGVDYSNCVMRYTISTKIWTIYNYEGNNITAMIRYDDGTDMNNIMGTETGRVNRLDSGFTDLGKDISFEMIDRWRSYTNMYAESKSLKGFNVYSDNGGGTKFQYQEKGDDVNQWNSLGEISEEINTLLPNVDTEDFNVSRLRLSGTTKGNPIVIHGIEVMRVEIEGYDKN